MLLPGKGKQQVRACHLVQVFLFNHSDRTLLGPLSAVSPGGMYIEERAWARPGHRSPWPAQVRRSVNTFVSSFWLFSYFLLRWPTHDSALVRFPMKLSSTGYLHACCQDWPFSSCGMMQQWVFRV